MAARTIERGRRKVVTTKRARAQEAGKLANGRWRDTFLAVLAETSNVTKSADAANVSPSRAYKVRREDAPFRRAWQEALCEGYDHLEMEVLRRLREGDFTTPEGGKFDFACALRILLAHRDSVGAERARQSDDDEEAVYASINAKIELLKKSWLKTPSLPVPVDGETGHGN